MRIIAIADDNLYKKVEKGTFLRELFHLLSASELQTVPLRRRREDIPDLLNYFLLQFFHNTDMTCDRIFFGRASALSEGICVPRKYS